MGTVGMILQALGGIAMLVFMIQILILAFKKSVGWGLASLLLPFAIFVFVAQNWAACKTPFLRWLMALVVFGIGSGLAVAGAVGSAMSAPVGG
jgi:hypothetical protein